MSVDPLVLLAFLPAALALNLTPGADMMFCLGQGLRSGPRSAIAASAGISLGAFVHTGLAGFGLSAVVAKMPGAFDVIRWIGVGYLIWLAISSLRNGMSTASTGTKITAKQAFWQGMIVNLFNPKVIFFVLAFIPQFVDPLRGSVVAQFLVFGLVLSLGGFIINAAVGIFAGGVGQRLTTNQRFARGLGIVSAGIFGALALRLALLERA